MIHKNYPLFSLQLVVETFDFQLNEMNLETCVLIPLFFHLHIVYIPMRKPSARYCLTFSKLYASSFFAPAF